jgi:tRNA G18 (ribose-2'-O)-methylase SpoU
MGLQTPSCHGLKKSRIMPDLKQIPTTNFLLDNLQSPINIGKVARVAEVFMMGMYINDPRNILQSNENIATIQDHSCGAWQRKKYNKVTDIIDFVKNYNTGRVIATTLSDEAIRMHDFEFCQNDLIVFGNEYDGIKSEIIEHSDAKIYIALPKLNLPKPPSHQPIDPSRDYEVSQNGINCLNVAVAAGIIGYEYYCWLERNGYYI